MWTILVSLNESLRLDIVVTETSARKDAFYAGRKSFKERR